MSDFYPPAPFAGGAGVDQTARDAAAAAQSTADAAVSTGAEFDALLKGDPTASAALDYRSPISVKDGRCGAKGDGVKLAAAGSMANGSAVLQLGSGQVASSGAAVGKSIAVKGALVGSPAGASWGALGTIAAINAGADTVTCSFACTAAAGVSATDVYLGTNDTAAFAAAKALLAAAGGGVMLVPAVPGFYFVTTFKTDDTWSNITIDLKARLFSASATPIFYYNDYPNQEFNLTGAALTGYARAGVYVVTLNDANDANKPLAGDMVAVMTSNDYNTTSVALGEFNEVESIVGTTVNLRHPLRHTMRPGCVATPPYQIVKILRPRDFHLRGGVLEQWTNLPYEVHGFRISVVGTHTESVACPAFRGRFIVGHYEALVRVAWPSSGSGNRIRRPYGIVIDTMTSDFDFKCKVVSDEHAILHLHEGVCHGVVDFDFSLGEVDKGVVADGNNWATVSVAKGIHDIRVKGEVRNCPGPSGFVNSGGSSLFAQGPENVDIDIRISGTTPNQLFRATANDTGLTSSISAGGVGCAIPLRWRGGRMTTPAVWADANLIFARGEVLTKSLALGDFTLAGGSTLTTQDGEAGILFPKASPGCLAEWQQDVDIELVRRRVMRIMVELMNGSTAGAATGNGGAPTTVNFQVQAAPVGLAGVAMAGAALTNPSIGVQGKNPCPLGAKSFFYPNAGIFTLDPENASNKLRVYFRLARSTSGDVFTGDYYIRRVWLEFYDPWASNIGLPPGPGPVTLTDAATVAFDASKGTTAQVTVTAARTMGFPTNVKAGKTYTYQITQNATGGFAITWAAGFKHNWSDTGNTANKRSVISFYAETAASLVQAGAQGPYV